MLIEPLCVASVVVALAAVLTYRFSHPASRWYILDVPNARSLHDHAKSRAGGIAILTAIFAGSVYMVLRRNAVDAPLIQLYIGLLAIAAIGYWDDCHSLAPLPRLVLQGVIAAALVASGHLLTMLQLPGLLLQLPEPLGVIITWLFVLWMINLYNFMDGMDGLAGGMAVIGFGTFALFGYNTHHELFFALNLIIANAALGFLIFNFPPARIFMGDAGAYSLGFLAAIFTLWGVTNGVFQFWVALLIFSPFISDATFTLLLRAWNRQRVWEAHREHMYQRVILAGIKKRNVLAIAYGLMLGCAITSVSIVNLAPDWQWLAIGLWLAAYSALFALVVFAERRAKQAQPA